MTAQRRNIPAFPLYAAGRNGDIDWRDMSFAERGLQLSIEIETWMNGSCPADTAAMARRLGRERAELTDLLTERVLRPFTRAGDDYIHPAQIEYRAQLDEKHRARASAGKKGAEVTNSGKRSGNADAAADRQGGNADPALNTNQVNTTQVNPVYRTGPVPEEHREWVQDYEGAAPTRSQPVRD